MKMFGGFSILISLIFVTGCGDHVEPARNAITISEARRAGYVTVEEGEEVPIEVFSTMSVGIVFKGPAPAKLKNILRYAIVKPARMGTGTWASAQTDDPVMSTPSGDVVDRLGVWITSRSGETRVVAENDPDSDFFLVLRSDHMAAQDQFQEIEIKAGESTKVKLFSQARVATRRISLGQADINWNEATISVEPTDEKRTAVYHQVGEFEGPFTPSPLDPPDQPLTNEGVGVIVVSGPGSYEVTNRLSIAGAVVVIQPDYPN